MSSAQVPRSPAWFATERERLVADPGVDHKAFPRACTQLTDRWLSGAFDRALQQVGVTHEGLALLATGGYGRGELCPGSDLDLLVIHDGSTAAGAVAEAIWYPVWDTGVKLGHALRGVGEAVEVVGIDLESTTAMLDSRLLSGDPDLFARFTDELRARWVAKAAGSRAWFEADATARLSRFGDVAYALEPNIKFGRGGLRDAQLAGWLAKGDLCRLGAHDAEGLDTSTATLLEIRVAMHRHSGRGADVLRSDDLKSVADSLGFDDVDTLRRRIAEAARSIAWTVDELWSAQPGRVSRVARRRHARRLDSAKPNTAKIDASDPVGMLRAARLVARSGTRFDRTELARFAASCPEIPDPWPPGAAEAFIDLLSCGAAAVGVIESLDHVGLWERTLPEWNDVRNRPQHTAHHRFTVDRHLLEAVAMAASLADRVARPDLLVLAALFHDLGKSGTHGDAENGVTLTRTLGVRLGLDEPDVETLTTLVRHHLLISEVATRRNLADGATIDLVASAVGSVDVLDLLVALTEADARATGPTAWSETKAELVATVARRVALRLSGDRTEQYGRVFPSVDQMLLLRAGVTSVTGEGHTLTVVAPDQPGLFSRVAGVLVLRGLSVTGADATSSQGMALEEFTVSSAFASAQLSDSVPVDWPGVISDIERAIAGRFAIEARVAERASTYRRRSRTADTEVRIRFDDAVDDVTVLEVDAPDAIGLLYRITRALGELSVDIRQARIETRTDRVVDAFSIVDREGKPVTDDAYRDEIERAIRFAVGS